MNTEQIKGIVERIATVLVAWAVGAGYVPEALSADIVLVFGLVASIAWGWWVNTPAQLEAAVEKTTQ